MFTDYISCNRYSKLFLIYTNFIVNLKINHYSTYHFNKNN